jgi:hypothetical protein
MRFTLISATVLTLATAFVSLPSAAEARLPGTLAAQGNAATVSGTARIERGPQGTTIAFENPYASRNLVGFVPFGNESTFGDLEALDGREVAITGIVVLDGQAKIIVTAPEQIMVI